MTLIRQTTDHVQVRFDSDTNINDGFSLRLKRRSPRRTHRILAYYVKPSDIYSIYNNENPLALPAVLSYWSSFQKNFTERTGLKASPDRFRDYGGEGYYIVLAQGTTPQRPQGGNEESRRFEELLRAIKELLMTEKEPKWYKAPW